MTPRDDTGARAPARASGSAGTAPGWVRMQVGDAPFAIAIEAVGEVLPTPDVSRVPMAPAWVAGIVSIRGDVIPVVDAGLRLFGRPSARDGRMVLASVGEERVALLVDAVAGLIDRADAHVDAAPTEDGDGSGVPVRFLAGFVRRGDSEAGTPVVDAGALLDPAIASAPPANDRA